MRRLLHELETDVVIGGSSRTPKSSLARLAASFAHIPPGRAAAFAVVVLTVVSLWGKLVKQFGFFIYRDSYYYLLIAENLRNHPHPPGRLGVGGMPFPPPGYAAMKLTYPLLVTLPLLFGVGSETAGHIVTATAAVLAVPAAYWAVRRWLDSRAVGMAAAALVATSYGITCWAGFVMSDSLSVLLGFVVLGLVAKTLPDKLGNIGDVALGVAMFGLLLSRPTYVVALPLLAYVAVKRWELTIKRAATSVGVAALALAVWPTWFPPVAFTGKVLLRLLPVLGAAALASAFALWLVHRVGREHRISRSATPWILAAAVSLLLILWAVQMIQSPAGGAGVFPALARFERRDFATPLLVLPGALVLLYRGKGLEVGALAAASAALLGVYYWTDPEESRYLIHVLPFLVPIAAGAILCLNRAVVQKRWRKKSARSTSIGGQRILSFLIVSALVVGCSLQANRSLRPAEASFLATAYPRDVSVGAESSVQGSQALITALPWPYYFHLRMPTWAAGVVQDPKFLEYVPRNAKLAVLEDASLRFHYRDLASALSRSTAAHMVGSFDVPTRYQYAYSSVVDEAPVRVWSISAGDLKTIADGLVHAGTMK